jgi:hypothetical protein
MVKVIIEMGREHYVHGEGYYRNGS